MGKANIPVYTGNQLIHIHIEGANPPVPVTIDYSDLTDNYGLEGGVGKVVHVYAATSIGALLPGVVNLDGVDPFFNGITQFTVTPSDTNDVEVYVVVLGA